MEERKIARFFFPLFGHKPQRNIHPICLSLLYLSSLLLHIIHFKQFILKKGQYSSYICNPIFFPWSSQVALAVKNLPANAGDSGEAGSIPGSGRSPGGGHDSPLQFSCLENPMDRGAWLATIHGVAKSYTTEHTHTHLCASLLLS